MCPTVNLIGLIMSSIDFMVFLNGVVERKIALMTATTLEPPCFMLPT